MDSDEEQAVSEVLVSEEGHQGSERRVRGNTRVSRRLQGEAGKEE